MQGTDVLRAGCLSLVPQPSATPQGFPLVCRLGKPVVPEDVPTAEGSSQHSVVEGAEQIPWESGELHRA